MAIIRIDRSQALDPSFFVDPLLPMPQDFAIEEQDDSSLVLTEIETINRLYFATYGEDCATGEEELQRLKEGDARVRLDAKVAQALLDNLSEQWPFLGHWNPKVAHSGIRFPGTVLRNVDGALHFAALRLSNGVWRPSTAALSSHWDDLFPLALYWVPSGG